MAPRLPELQEEAPGRAVGGPGARRPRPAQPSPVPVRPRRASRTHLAVELADRHDRAGRAEPRTPCPAGRPLARSLAPRRAAGPGSSLPRWLSVHGRPAWRHLPGLAESCYASRPFPRPVPPASWRRRSRLAPRRRDLYSRGGGPAGVALGRAGEEAARRRSPLRYGREEVPARGGRTGGGVPPPPPPLRPTGAGLGAPSRVPAAAGSSGPGAGRARSGRRPPPAGRRAHAGQVRAGCRTCRTALRAHAGSAWDACAGM